MALGHSCLNKASLLPCRAGWESAVKQPATEDLGFVHPLESPRERVRCFWLKNKREDQERPLLQTSDYTNLPDSSYSATTSH